MTKCNIDCMAYNKETNIRDWEVNAEGRIWPCCYFANAWDKKMNKGSKESARLFNDTEFKKHINEDYNFNKLSHHDLDTIVDHPYFNQTVWFPGWEGDNPHAICSEQCEVIIDEMSGEEKSKSTLATTSKKTTD